MRGEKPETDWETAWKIERVTDDEWLEMKRALAERKLELETMIDAAPGEIFADPDILGGTYGIVAHNAFHLGQIRHAAAITRN